MFSLSEPYLLILICVFICAQRRFYYGTRTFRYITNRELLHIIKYTIILHPIVEEIFFKIIIGYILHPTVTSIIFTIVHIDTRYVNNFDKEAFLGLISIFLLSEYVSRFNIFYKIITHSTFNLFILLFEL